MKVVIELPRLVADHDVVATRGDHLVADHEVGDEDLVHLAQALEHRQLVLPTLGFDVARFAGHQRRRRMDGLARVRKHRVTGSWASHSISSSGWSCRSSWQIATSRRA